MNGSGPFPPPGRAALGGLLALFLLSFLLFPATAAGAVVGERARFEGADFAYQYTLAEGCVGYLPLGGTRPPNIPRVLTFDTYITIVNSGKYDSPGWIKYVFADRPPETVNYTFPAGSRFTVRVRDVVGERFGVAPERLPLTDVAFLIRSQYPLAVERPVYFYWDDESVEGYPYLAGSHNARALAQNELGRSYEFAEGCTAYDFTTYLTVLNPNDQDLTLHLSVFTQEEGRKDYDLEVGAWRRGTWSFFELLGGEYNFGFRVEADLPFMAERPMYFTYWPLGSPKFSSVRGGHCVVGRTEVIPEERRDYAFFGEGYTGTNFHTWLCLVNPNDFDVVARTTYCLAGKAPVGKEYVIGPGRRHTVFVADEIGWNQETSIIVEGAYLGGGMPAPIIAERPMYFLYPLFVPGEPKVVDYASDGHCSLGHGYLTRSVSFAEGCTFATHTKGYDLIADTYVCLANPHYIPVTVNLIFYTGEGEKKIVTKQIPPLNRATVKANDVIGPGKEVSVKVVTEPEQVDGETLGIVAEEVTYILIYPGFVPPGWLGIGYLPVYKGGHCTDGTPGGDLKWVRY